MTICRTESEWVERGNYNREYERNFVQGDL